jgi:hypothetical protein
MAAVHFPAELPNHNPDQVFYYDFDLAPITLDIASVEVRTASS